MEAMYIVLSMLAVWRATYMLQEETGPFGIFNKFQAWFWSPNVVRRGGLKDGLRCFNCTSVWISLLATIAIQREDIGLFIITWLAIAAGAMLINILVNKYEQ